MPRAVNRLSALLVRTFSSTSTAVRPERVNLAGDGALRTRRVPDGPGLAYFIESYSNRDAEQATAKRGEDKRGWPRCTLQDVVFLRIASP